MINWSLVSRKRVVDGTHYQRRECYANVMCRLGDLLATNHYLIYWQKWVSLLFIRYLAIYF